MNIGAASAIRLVQEWDNDKLDNGSLYSKIPKARVLAGGKFLCLEVYKVSLSQYEGFVNNFETTSHSYCSRLITVHNCDTSSGDGKDFTDIAVYKIGYGIDPHEQVAEFHGLINPSHTARVLAALGYWYHTAEIAVEYMGSGISCGDDLRVALDYSAIYRWKTLDRLNSNSQHIHWITNSRTREDMINRMNECLLDGQVVLRNKHLIEEMRDFGWEERDTRAEALSGNDDMVAANCIALCALHQSGKRQAYAESLGDARGDGSKHAYLLPRAPSIFSVYNQFGQAVDRSQIDGKSDPIASVEEGHRLIAMLSKKYNIDLAKHGWKVIPVTVSKANTAYSALWDSTGAESELAKLHGFGGRDQMIDPSTVAEFRKFAHLRARFGTNNTQPPDLSDILEQESASVYNSNGSGEGDEY
jgi:hypothetical protein